MVGVRRFPSKGVTTEGHGMLRIGIDLGGTKTAGIVLDPDGREVARLTVPSPRDRYDGTIDTVCAVVRRLESTAGGRATVGVGMPGAISPRSGLLKNANSHWLNGRPFDRDLADSLGRPVRVENDANCLAVSEASDGAAAGAAVVFAAILGTGTGAGIAIGGRVLTGRHAIGGEWGHNPLPWPRDDERPGPACYCGKAGCLETWLSGPAITADHHGHGAPALTAVEIAALADAGDAAAVATFDRWLDRLARGLATVINVLDPDVIVMGGGLSRVERVYRDLPRLLPAWVFSDGCDTPVRPALHGSDSGVRGAAWLWTAEEAARPSVA